MYYNQGADKDDKVASICEDFNVYQSARYNWDNHWEEIAALVAPGHYREFNSYGANNRYSRGEKRTQDIFDSTAPIALVRATSIVDSLITPSGKKYQKLVASNEELRKETEVSLWFDELTRALFKYRYYPQSNFSSQNFESLFSMNGYGTGCLFTDFVNGRIRYLSVHLSQLYIATNELGIVDKIYRYFPMRGKEILDRWGETLPSDLADLLKNKLTVEMMVLHRTQVNPDWEPLKFDSFQYTSDYILMDNKYLLEEGGYHEFPYSTCRYRISPGEVYGRSPVMEILPSIKTLNEQKKTILKQGQLATDPIYIAADDSILDSWSNLPGYINPGAVSHDGKALVQALPPGNISVGMDLVQDERATINDALFISLFQILVETPRMTATEVLERVREKGDLLSPTIGRQESEYLSQLTTREVDILIREGLVSEMPEVLQEAEGEYDIVFDTPMTRSRRAEEAGGLMRAMEHAMNLSLQLKDPKYMDYFDLDEAMPFLAEAQSVSPRFMNDVEEVRQIREERASARTQQMDLEAMPGQASLIKAASSAAKDLNEGG